MSGFQHAQPAFPVGSGWLVSIFVSPFTDAPFDEVTGFASYLLCLSLFEEVLPCIKLSRVNLVDRGVTWGIAETDSSINT